MAFTIIRIILTIWLPANLGGRESGFWFGLFTQAMFIGIIRCDDIHRWYKRYRLDKQISRITKKLD